MPMHNRARQGDRLAAPRKIAAYLTGVVARQPRRKLLRVVKATAGWLRSREVRNLGESDIVGRFLHPTTRSLHGGCSLGHTHTPEAIALSILLQPLKVILPIGITAKNDVPLIASTDHMIKRPGKLNSRFSCHDAALSHSPVIMHYESPTLTPYPSQA